MFHMVTPCRAEHRFRGSFGAGTLFVKCMVPDLDFPDFRISHGTGFHGTGFHGTGFHGTGFLSVAGAAESSFNAFRLAWLNSSAGSH